MRRLERVRAHMRQVIERARIDDEAEVYADLCMRGLPLAKVEQALEAHRVMWERETQLLIDHMQAAVMEAIRDLERPH